MFLSDLLPVVCYTRGTGIKTDCVVAMSRTRIQEQEHTSGLARYVIFRKYI
jgi:hypothetical protein